jgi:hypothetical protein
MRLLARACCTVFSRMVEIRSAISGMVIILPRGRMTRRTRGMLKRMAKNQKASEPLVREGSFKMDLIFNLDKLLQGCRQGYFYRF